MAGTEWGLTPRQSIEFECRRRSEKQVVDDCVAILSRRRVDEATLVALAGPHALTVIGGGEGGVEGYWPRVWALRGLLYAWDDSATGAVIAASNDSHWRVREMSAKVVARRRLEDAHDAMAALVDDEVPRVRAAAERALIRLAQSGSSPSVPES
jgi:HEAT repeat protein